MLKLKSFRFAVRVVALGLMGMGLSLEMGCFADATAILGQEVAEQFGIRKDSVFLRVANRGDSIQELQIEVDGELITLPQCAPATGGAACDFILSTCPQTIELVQETRYDENGGFNGGRTFNANEDFIFRRGEFQCGSWIFFEFTDTTATATVLN